MKKFFRGAMGKTALFICCVLTTVLLVASIITIEIFFDNDAYSKTEKQLYNEFTDSMVEYDMNRAFDEFVNSYDSLVVENKGNLVYEITDTEGNVLKKSESADQIENWDYVAEYDLKHSVSNGLIDESEALSVNDSLSADDYIVSATIQTPFEVNDKYQIIAVLVSIAYSLKFAIYFLVLLFIIVDVFSFVALVNNIGRSDEDDELHVGLFHKVPFDLLVILFAILIPISIEGLNMSYSIPAALFYVVVVFTILVALFLGLISTFVIRVKTHTLIENTITYKVIILIKDVTVFIWKSVVSLFNAIPIVWKTILAVGIIITLNVIFHYSWEYEIAKSVLLVPLAIYIAMNMKKLSFAAEKMANGDLSSQVETKGLIGDFKQHGQNLNQVNEGMVIAVEEKLKSERMKTELITNVSHDIKTPLTSIINYATFIGNEKTDNERIKEYAEVLVRQSNKLKRLIEDLVEASKASTGNLEVFLAPCDANVFLMQAAGEYQEKLEQNHLTLVTKQTEDELRIMADGRRMWRIFDNLMNNICKYAQENTRVYLSIEELDHQAVITFKNTSRDQLDMSEEELMERFTRGDHSRNTEGNGLGLNIARSLAELQSGSLTLEIDGDLFKAILKFPIIEEEQKDS